MNQDDKKKIADIMERNGVVVGYLFGSALRGTMGPHSDIDVAVFFDQPENEKSQENCKEKIRDEISHIFNREMVDVINLNQQTNPVLLHDAVLASEAILVKDATIRANLSSDVLREYENTRYLRETSYRILRAQILSGEFGRAPTNPRKYVTN